MIAPEKKVNAETQKIAGKADKAGENERCGCGVVQVPGEDRAEHVASHREHPKK